MSFGFTAATWGMIAAGATLASAGMVGYSQYAAGENAKKVGDYNAEMNNRAAADVQARGAIDAAEHRMKVRRMISTQNAAFGASGIATDSGSALDVTTETAGMGELDALRIVSNSSRTAANLNANAELEKIQGENARSAGYMNATGTILGGIGSAAGTYKKGT